MAYIQSGRELRLPALLCRQLAFVAPSDSADSNSGEKHLKIKAYADKRIRQGRVRARVQKTASAVSNNVEPPHLLKSLIIEAWSEGERRAYALAWLEERAPQQMYVRPYRLREVGGCNIPFRCGEPIAVEEPIRTVDDACRVLTAWATYTVALNAKPHR